MKKELKNRFFTFLSIALFIVIVIELGYLILSKQTPIDIHINNKNPKIVNNSTREASIYSFLSIFRGFDKDVLESATITTQFKGTIIEVLTKPGISIKSHLKYDKGLVMQGNSKRSHEFLYRTKNMPFVKVYRENLGYKTEINFSDLNIGNRVKIIEIFDLANNAPYTLKEVEIIII